MKILITTDLYTIKTNGVVTSIRNLTDELSKRGHEIRILTLSRNHHSYQEDNVYYMGSVSIGYIYPNVRMPISYCHKLTKKLIAWKPDIIHSHCEFFSYEYARRIAHKCGSPLVHTYHTLYDQYLGYVTPFQKLNKPLVGIISKLRLKKVSLLIAPTLKVQNTLLDYKIKNPIAVIPTGIDLAQYHYRFTDSIRNEMRAKLGIPKNAFVLLFLGRLGEEKNPQELINFFTKAAPFHPDLFLLIVGSGPAEKTLKKLAQKSGFANRILFTGMVSPEDVQNYYQLGDVFVNASTSESQGLTYIEAAANGLPLLCRKDACLDGVLFNGENGFYYTNEDDFLERLHLFIYASQWYQNAKRRSEEIATSYDKAIFAERIEDVYNSFSHIPLV